MARFEIEVPDSKLDFVLELFNSFSFFRYQAMDPEPKEPEIGNPKKNTAQQINHKNRTDRLSQLAELREAINNIQNSRESNNQSTQSLLFRFPDGTEIGAIKLKNYNHLTSFVEDYYRTNIKDMNFIPTIGHEGFEMDKYEVYITLNDNTQFKAGYCNQKLK
jgi:hypothetical protein